MRKLNFADIFVAGRIIKKLERKEKIKDIYSKVQEKKKDISSEEEKETLTEDTGIDVIYAIFTECVESKMENALYEFLAGPFEMKPEEVKNLEIEEVINKFKQLAKENNLIDFFKKAGQLKL